MNNENPSFFDGRTMIAIAIVAITFIAWQRYMQSKYPEAFQPKTEVEGQAKTDAPVADKKAEVPAAAATGARDKSPEAPVVDRPEQLHHFESEDIVFDISSRGMGIKNFRAKKYKDRKGEVIQLGATSGDVLPFETRLLGRTEPLHFDIRQVNPNLYVGRARIGELEVTKTLEIQPEIYLFKTKVSTQGQDERFIGLTTLIADDVVPAQSGGFLMPAFEVQEFFVETTETDERVTFGDENEEKSWAKVRLASVGSQYFTQAIVDRSGIMPEAKGKIDQGEKNSFIRLDYPMLNKADGVQLEYLGFMGPKSHDLLQQIDLTLAHVVNFGFFNWIARQILGLLHWFHALVGNWGVAIVLMTILVRLIVLPANVYSYKSMRKMQVIQPQIQALRERYKDDQAKQQQEMMALMRENKVNPIGGCLPVLLQFPIFIALYQVLGHSIELYQAPFMLWIDDLSLKDPYYILPVLMGVTMFIQQKITPNTMDPAQARIMLMMPLVFTIFMVTLPSGLTLYMWVGAVFSVLQQLYFMRNPAPVLKEAR